MLPEAGSNYSQCSAHSGVMEWRTVSCLSFGAFQGHAIAQQVDWALSILSPVLSQSQFTLVENQINWAK